MSFKLAWALTALVAYISVIGVAAAHEGAASRATGTTSTSAVSDVDVLSLESLADINDEPFDVVYRLDEDSDTLVFSLPDEEGLPADCAGVEVTADDDGNIVIEGGFESCMVVSVTGPSGKVNHGSIVSAFTKSLDKDLLNGPKGQVVREIANSDLGKDEKQSDIDEQSNDETGGKPHAAGVGQGTENRGQAKKAGGQSKGKAPKA